MPVWLGGIWVHVLMLIVIVLLLNRPLLKRYLNEYKQKRRS
jgi:lipopolysaccharide export system permease protein